MSAGPRYAEDLNGFTVELLEPVVYVSELTDTCRYGWSVRYGSGWETWLWNEDIRPCGTADEREAS